MIRYSEALEFLSGLEFFGIKLGLSQIAELLERIGNPHEKLRFIHVAGTNGKGSVSAMLAVALTTAGFKTAFYSSPHLVTVRERFRIDGKAIQRKKFAELIGRIRPHVENMKSCGESPTYFEVTTALAAMYFAEAEVDFVLWETGMGGRFDATNTITPVVSIITSIGIDHTRYLGTHERDIAFEKAGIIKPGIPLFCGDMSITAKEVILSQAAKNLSRCYFSDGKIKITKKMHISGGKTLTQKFKIGEKEFALSLLGNIQAKNAALAFRVLEYLAKCYNFNLDSAVSGLAHVKWPARFQILPDGSVLDGAHNPQAIRSLVSSLKEYFPGEKFSVIYGSLADKDVEANLRKLSKIAGEFIFVPIRSSRKSFSVDELAEILRRAAKVFLRKESSIHSVLLKPHKGRFLITGSLYLAGEVLREYYKERDVINI